MMHMRMKVIQHLDGEHVELLKQASPPKIHTIEEAALHLSHLFLETLLRPPFGNLSIQGHGGLGVD